MIQGRGDRTFYGKSMTDNELFYLNGKLTPLAKRMIERGIPEHSHFKARFRDDSERTEHNTNWSDFSEKREVIFGDNKKIVYVSKHPLKELTIKHGDLETTITAKEGEELYQAIISMSMLRDDGTVENKIIGRRIGHIKNGRVLEERVIDGRMNEILGLGFNG